MKHYHTIRVTYHGATNTRSSRITLKSWRFKQSVTIPYSYEGDTMEQAERWLIAKGFNLIGFSDLEGTSHYLIFTDTFQALK